MISSASAVDSALETVLALYQLLAVKPDQLVC